MRATSKDPIRIEPARRPDLAAIVTVHVEADRQTYQPIFGAAFVRREDLAATARWTGAFDAGDVLLVARDEGRVVGFAHAAGHWMSALCLLASHHRRGLGTRLLNQLRSELAARGVASFGFQVVAENLRAIAFYQARGARLVDRKTEREDGRSWDELVFEMPTAPSSAFPGRSARCKGGECRG